VLVLGAGGMLGHKLVQQLRCRVECWGSVRQGAADYSRYDFIDPKRLLDHVDATEFDTVVDAVRRARPSVVVNCIGILKQLPAAQDPIATLRVNALFPQRLAPLCETAGAWLIHISTDCVFSGRRGAYAENDVADAEDLYGRTKLLGEPNRPATLVLRTSMIGRELRSSVGLLEWLVSQKGRPVKGYTKARFSGLTTLALANLVGDLIARRERLIGLFHVGAQPIDKYDLLARLNRGLQLGVTIESDDRVVVDRTLNSQPFWQTIGIRQPGWDELIAAIAADPTPYDEWRRTDAS
jgi:dTDP-4-dehydrorhamnose reductase